MSRVSESRAGTAVTKVCQAKFTLNKAGKLRDRTPNLERVGSTFTGGCFDHMEAARVLGMTLQLRRKLRLVTPKVICVLTLPDCASSEDELHKPKRQTRFLDTFLLCARVPVA